MLIQTVLRLSKWLNTVGGLTLVLLMLVTVADVILRSFRKPIPGVYELVALAGAIVISFALPLTSWNRGHISVDFLVAKLPISLRKAVDLFTRLLGMGFFFLSGCFLVKMGLKLYRSGEVTLTLQIPFYPITYAVGICCYIQCLVYLCDIVRIVEGKYE